MLTVDITASLASTIGPNGLADAEINDLHTPLKRAIEEYWSERDRGEHDWANDPKRTESIAKCKAAAESLKSKKIETVIWIGIGGSGLGPQVIQEMYEGPNTLEFILLDTLDPAILKETVEYVDWKKTAVVVVSKSGGTLEPMSVFTLCWEYLKNAQGDKAGEYCIAITDPEKGTLNEIAIREKLTILPIPPDVGGRFSVLCPVGILPLALLGADVDAFVQGCTDMDDACRATTIPENPAALLATAQYLLDTKHDYPLRVIMPYSHRLRSIGRWNQQLVAESLGKNEGKNPIPVAAIGTKDQHSLLQQWMEGPRSQWMVFIRTEQKPEIRVPKETEERFSSIAGKPFGTLLDACYYGTSQALTDDKRPHATITLQAADEHSLGALFFLFCTETVLLGKLYRIDPYGQPGVEAGKQITNSILSET